MTFDSKEYMKLYRQQNKENLSEYNKQWRQLNNNYHKQYEQLNKTKITERKKQWYQFNKEKRKEYGKQYRQLKKEKIFEYYSNGQNCCACCGETQRDFLTVDHIDENGAEHRKKIGSGRLYKWLVKNNFPSGFQVLCWNCNCSRSYPRNNGICPHAKQICRITGLIAQ